RIPHVSLVSQTTPIVEQAPLAERYQAPGRFFVKRDDLTSSRYGGNKVRKLEWLLGAALKQKARAVLTLGAWGSHHALSTTIFAAQLGLVPYLVLYPQPITDHVRETYFASVGASARVLPARTMMHVPLAITRAHKLCRRAGHGPLLTIAAGGSSALGVLGYVETGLEIARQVAEGDMPAPTHVYAAAGTCGTVAGLAIGLALGARWAPALRNARVLGVRVVPRAITNDRTVRRLIHGAASLLRRRGLFAMPDPLPVTILGGQLGRGYGHPTEAGAAALAAADELAQLELDPTYTAKAVAGALTHAKTAPAGSVHLYCHTLSSADLSPFQQRAAAVNPPFPPRP
ncbi:MAG: 1-aminocyclopropane-1-carboxylate deaminase/D-cysteine desulfhydrase, partial [Planctomycetota bacterium]